MLLQIDTENTPVSQLRAIVALLSLTADERSAQPSGFDTAPPPPNDPPPAGDAEDDDGIVDTVAPAAPLVPPPPAPPPPPPPPRVPMAAPDLAVADVPPPPSAVPTVNVQPAGFEFDSANVAWNAEIHSSTKSKMKNGQWKKKRNRSGDAPATEPATTSSAPAAAAEPAQQTLPAVPPPPPPPPPAAAAPAAQPAATGPTFRSVVARVGELQKAQRLPPEVLAAILADAGAVDLMSLLSMPHLVPAVDAAITKATG